MRRLVAPGISTRKESSKNALQRSLGNPRGSFFVVMIPPHLGAGIAVREVPPELGIGGHMGTGDEWGRQT